MGCGSSNAGQAVEGNNKKTLVPALFETSRNTSVHVSPSVAAEIDISFSLQGAARIQAYLYLQSEKFGLKKLASKTFCDVSSDGKQGLGLAKISVPVPGSYRLVVFAKPGDKSKQQHESSPKAYHYDINVPSKKSLSHSHFSMTAAYESRDFSDIVECQDITTKELKNIQESFRKKEKPVSEDDTVLTEKSEADDKPLTSEEIEKLRHKLRLAIKAKHKDHLQKYIGIIEAKHLIDTLKEEYDMAQKVLATVLLNYRILHMESRTMCEIRNYRTPPLPVHEVMIAALLLLGNHEEKTRNWLTCKALLETTSLRRRIDQFDVSKLHPEVAARALELVQRYQLAEVCLASAGSGPFYNWVLEMTNNMPELSSGSVKPANEERQKEIFQVRPPSPRWISAYL